MKTRKLQEAQNGGEGMRQATWDVIKIARRARKGRSVLDPTYWHERLHGLFAYSKTSETGYM